MTFWTKQNYGDRRQTSRCQGLGDEWTGKAQRIFRGMKTLCVLMDTCSDTSVKTHKMCSAKSKLWGKTRIMMTCRCGFVLSKKCSYGQSPSDRESGLMQGREFMRNLCASLSIFAGTRKCSWKNNVFFLSKRKERKAKENASETMDRHAEVRLFSRCGWRLTKHYLGLRSKNRSDGWRLETWFFLACEGTISPSVFRTVR